MSPSLKILYCVEIIFYCLEALSFIVGFIYWKKVKNSYYKWFVIYLLYIFFADFAGALIIKAGIPNEKYYDYYVS